MRGVFLSVIPIEESEIIYREKGCLILQIEQTPFSLLPLLLTSLGYTMEMFCSSIRDLTFSASPIQFIHFLLVSPYMFIFRTNTPRPSS
jgi:hypothetical protein